MSINEIKNKISIIKEKYDKQKLTGQDCIQELDSLKTACLQNNMNLENYFYRNGILNKNTAIISAKNNIQKYVKFPNYQNKFKYELKSIQNSKQEWFNNYGIHDSPLHDLIKPQLDKYKVDGLLSSLLCDLYVGTYNEGSNKPLMLSPNK